jgi:ubiquinone/menaquinone biosynthesis C-methylase UbiE
VCLFTIIDFSISQDFCENNSRAGTQPWCFLMMNFLGIFLRLLYHQLSWTYDFVAALVSAGKWSYWVSSVNPYLQGPRILELGFGPGHLQIEMARSGFEVYGIDESKQMAKMAIHRVKKGLKQERYIGYAHFPVLCRALAQHLPFQTETFDTIVSTFPTPYIFDPASLTDIYRVLNREGKLIVLLSAKTAGMTWFERISNGIFHLTGQVIPIDPPILEPFLKAHFHTQSLLKRESYGQVTLIIATKLRAI